MVETVALAMPYLSLVPQSKFVRTGAQARAESGGGLSEGKIRCRFASNHSHILHLPLFRLEPFGHSICQRAPCSELATFSFSSKHNTCPIGRTIFGRLDRP